MSPARWMFRAAAEVLADCDLLAVEGDDEVAAEHDGRVALVGALGAAVEAGFFGGAAGQDTLDEDAVVGGQADLLGDVGADGEGDDVERGAADAAVFGEVVDHGLGGVDGDGEADAGGLVGAVGGDEGGDADDLAARVEQRAAGVAGVDGGIGLDGVFDGGCPAGRDGADGGDDAAVRVPREPKGLESRAYKERADAAS